MNDYDYETDQSSDGEKLVVVAGIGGVMLWLLTRHEENPPPPPDDEDEFGPTNLQAFPHPPSQVDIVWFPGGNGIIQQEFLDMIITNDGNAAQAAFTNGSPNVDYASLSTLPMRHHQGEGYIINNLPTPPAGSRVYYRISEKINNKWFWTTTESFEAV